jgi:hypothetical protein
LIDGPPETMAGLVDRATPLLQIPFVPQVWPLAAPCVGGCVPELPTPRAPCLIRQADAALRHQRFNLPVAQAKAQIQPDPVAKADSSSPSRLVQYEPSTCLELSWRGCGRIKPDRARNTYR